MKNLAVGNILKKKTKDPYEEISKEYPIIMTKPFFHFDWSLYKLKSFLQRR